MGNPWVIGFDRIYCPLSLCNGDKLIRGAVRKLYVKQLAELFHCFHIEVEEILPPLFEKRTKVVLVVFEERTLTIGRQEGIPMDMSPVTMVADAHIFHRTFYAVKLIYGNGKRLRTIGRGYNTAVTVGLLDEVIVPFYQAGFVAVELLIPLDRTEIGGGQKSLAKSFRKEGMRVAITGEAGLLHKCRLTKQPLRSWGGA